MYWSSFYKPQLVFPWEAHNSFAWVPGLSLKSKWLFIISPWETTPLFEISSFPRSLGYIFIWYNYSLKYGFPGKVFSYSGMIPLQTLYKDVTTSQDGLILATLCGCVSVLWARWNFGLWNGKKNRVYIMNNKASLINQESILLREVNTVM